MPGCLPPVRWALRSARGRRLPSTWPAGDRSWKARPRRRRFWPGRCGSRSRCRFARRSMLSSIAARASTRRSAPCWRVLSDAKGSEMAYWLLKSEPSSYSWDQLVKEKRTAWTGVRNFQASANLKAMKAGDRCFFYHSGEGKEIVGIAEVVKTAYPDPTDKEGQGG